MIYEHFRIGRGSRRTVRWQPNNRYFWREFNDDQPELGCSQGIADAEHVPVSIRAQCDADRDAWVEWPLL